MYPFNLNVVDPSWKECLERGLSKIQPSYLEKLIYSPAWLPGPQKIFNAFSLSLNHVNYVLFGESPYPRRESANGYAFWDADVNELWAVSGLHKKVNRATSLRNFLKMLLVAEGMLDKNKTDQPAIAAINKINLIQSNHELFTNLLNHGFLLLNATLVLQNNNPHKDARAWYPFIQELLYCLLEKRPNVKFILFGGIAKTIDTLIEEPHIEKLYAEHPYNHSFVLNKDVLNFFRPLHLLRKKPSK